MALRQLASHLVGPSQFDELRIASALLPEPGVMVDVGTHHFWTWLSQVPEVGSGIDGVDEPKLRPGQPSLYSLGMVKQNAQDSIWPPATDTIRVGDEMTFFKQFLAPVLEGDEQLPVPLAFSLASGYESDQPHRRGLIARARRKFNLARIPYTATVREFAQPGVKFEVGSRVEWFRIVDHGGETRYTHRMLQTLRSDDVLWDIGVCVGMVALHAARECTVIGFEPDPDVRARFAHNLDLNPHTSVDIYPYAISDIDGTATFHLGDRTSSSLRRQQDEQRAVDVETRTLDTLAFDDGLTAPTVVKFDIEGAELPALQGASKLLTSNQRPRLLFLEVHRDYLPAFGGTALDVLDLVEGHGYFPVWAAVRWGQVHMILEAR